jgi:uncharacterized membrane protein YqaE (UPF0057 family)
MGDKKNTINRMVASIPHSYVHENVNFGTVLKDLLISLMLTILSWILGTRLSHQRIKKFCIVCISGEQSMGHWTSQDGPLANFNKISYKNY